MTLYYDGVEVTIVDSMVSKSRDGKLDLKLEILQTMPWENSPIKGETMWVWEEDEYLKENVG